MYIQISFCKLHLVIQIQTYVQYIVLTKKWKNSVVNKLTKKYVCKFLLVKNVVVRSGIRTHALIRGPEISVYREGFIPWVWRLRPLGHPDILIIMWKNIHFQYSENTNKDCFDYPAKILALLENEKSALKSLNFDDSKHFFSFFCENDLLM